LWQQMKTIMNEKYEAKEAYYGKLIEYEIEQKFMRDIQWLSSTKATIMERKDREAKYKAQQLEREMQRLKYQEEKKKQEQERKLRQE
jgi:hypothetical protein